MMNDDLFEILEDATLGTEWQEWMKDAERASVLVNPRRPETWAVLRQPAKNIAAMRWLTGKLRRLRPSLSPEAPSECALYILAAHCRDNTVLGYVADTFVNSYRTQHRAGTLFCMEVVGRMTLHDEYPHLNALYNLMMGLALREWRRLLEGNEDYPCFLTEADFRRVERSLPDFRYGGFKEMVRSGSGARRTSSPCCQIPPFRCPMSPNATASIPPRPCRTTASGTSGNPPRCCGKTQPDERPPEIRNFPQKIRTRLHPYPPNFALL